MLILVRSWSTPKNHHNFTAKLSLYFLGRVLSPKELGFVCVFNPDVSVWFHACSPLALIALAHCIDANIAPESSSYPYL